MNERMPASQESEPVPGISQAIYNGVQVELMKQFGPVKWFEKDMAPLYADYASSNPDKILATANGDIESDELLKHIQSGGLVH